MLHLVLVRGHSGSGKSTFVKQSFICYPNHYEADQYFDIGGVYAFDASKPKEAHAWCQWKTEQALMRGFHTVVSNTFTQLWEMQHYIDLSNKYHCRLSVYRCNADYQNVHGVDIAVVERQKARMQDYAGESFV